MATGLRLPGGVLSMTAEAADRLVKAGNGDQALLYLHLLRLGGGFAPDAARRALGWTGDRVRAAFDGLVALGLADAGAEQPAAAAPPEPDSPPEYTAGDIARELEGGSSFPGLVGEVERRLGKVLSTADLKMLYTLYDYLALPAEVVLLLVNWCIEENQRKYGEGRMPRMVQIRREGFIWRRLGVDTPEAADAHLRQQARLRGREKELLPLLDIAGRPPVEQERKYLDSWVQMGFDNGAIRLAYEKTVFKKQSLNWPYMNSILKSWHQKGLHTARQVADGDSGLPRRRGALPGAPDRPGDGNRPVPASAKADMDWMDRFLEETGSAKEGH